jgi:hypothetical protein
MVGLHATDNSWDVLSRWARPGIAAALAFILGAATWVILQTAAEPQSLADAMLPGDAPAPLFSATARTMSGYLKWYWSDKKGLRTKD